MTEQREEKIIMKKGTKESIETQQTTAKDIEKWSVVDSEYLIRRPWLTARRDHVQLPSGAEMDEYYVLEYPNWINVIAITKDKRFVMERQYRHALGVVKYELCAGCCEAGEDTIESAKRELYEETGYAGGRWTHFMTLSPNPSSMNNLSYTFLAEDVERVSEQHLEDTEDISVHLMTIDEVYDILKRGDIVQALMAAPLWRYFAERRD